MNVILNFADKATEDIYDGTDSKAARRVPRALWKPASRKLDLLNAAAALDDLRIPPGNRLERLKGRMSEYHSIRINEQYRIVFKWAGGNVHSVRIEDYH